jgi:putative NADPH-quinone reductase
MRVLVVFDHPYGLGASENIPHKRSFSAALAAAAVRGLKSAGHEVDVIDLHQDGFDPVMSATDLAEWRAKTSTDPQVLDYQARLVAADHLVFVFPVWWEVMPAMTKGFIDKVIAKGIAKGIAYEQPGGRRPFRSKLPGLRGVTMVTVMSTPTAVYRVWFGNPVVKAMFRGTFRKIGVRHLCGRNHAGVEGKTPEARAAILARTEARFAAFT